MMALLFEPLQFGFMQNALIISLVVAIRNRSPTPR